MTVYIFCPKVRLLLDKSVSGINHTISLKFFVSPS